VKGGVHWGRGRIGGCIAGAWGVCALGACWGVWWRRMGVVLREQLSGLRGNGTMLTTVPAQCRPVP
jgi:hypothetical protein